MPSEMTRILVLNAEDFERRLLTLVAAADVEPLHPDSWRLR